MDNLRDLIIALEKVKNKGWIQATNNGNCGIGTTLEQELNINSGDFEIPDFEGIELKTKKIGALSNITLFSATPDSYLYEIKRLHKQYGYPHTKYPEYKVFNTTICGRKFTPMSNKYHMIIHVDWKNEKVVLHVHDKYSGALIDDKSSWSFEILKEKLYRKLKYMCLVKAQRKYEFPYVYYRYTDYNFYVLKSFEDFIKAIENGIIKITFKINVFTKGHKQGEIHDHGTSFDINEDDLEKIYYKI